MDQPPESANSKSGGFGSVLLWALVVYLTPIAAIFVDERMLKTFWFINHLPDWSIEALRRVYFIFKYLPY